MSSNPIESTTSVVYKKKTFLFFLIKWHFLRTSQKFADISPAKRLVESYFQFMHTLSQRVCCLQFFLLAPFFCRFHIHDVKWYVFCIVSFLVAPFLLLMKMRKLKIYAYITRVYAVFVLQFLCTWCAYTILHVCVVFMPEKAILVTTRERSISSKYRSRNLPNYSVIVWTWNGWTHALKLCLFSHQIKFLWVVFFFQTQKHKCFGFVSIKMMNIRFRLIKFSFYRFPSC